ncbi:uncharacterized protein LOC132205894 [Neocloeon triangulifer]|uniref:uncharacterized protein LOC132205894 n=1 Tax=Neocloeon triangulifer TaxID=2078957 RepID=UPI00286F9468|nr:uncharacterized protein LOC132205894 [Neocloeon triangulifer]
MDQQRTNYAPLSRITIDMSNFFQDERKSCCKSLDYKSLKKVSDLQNYLTTEMGITEETQLMLGNSILFGSDDLRVIRDEDVVKLIRSKFGRAVENETRTLEKLRTTSDSVESPPSVANNVESDAKISDHELNEDNLDAMWPLPKRKRTRKRRGKKKSEEQSEEEIVKVEIVPPEPKKFPRRQENNSNKRMHIRFDDDGPLPKAISNGYAEVAENKYDEQMEVSEIVPPEAAEKPIIFRRAFKPIEVKEEKQNPYDSYTDQNLFDLPPVTETPKANEIIAFRMLYISENFVPELSEWLIGKVAPDGDAPEGLLGLNLLRGKNPKNEICSEDNGSVESEVFLVAAFEDLAMPRMLPHENGKV